MRKIACILLITILSSSCKDNEKSSTSEGTSIQENQESKSAATITAERIASASGIENWDQIQEVSFTFNVDRGERHFDRTFIWNTKNGDVQYISQNDTIQYNRSQVDSTSMGADKGFVNDSYWLMAPFHLVWDEGTTLDEGKAEIAPISKDTLDRITLVYPDQGGYTPGDAYDFYFDENYIVREWVFRQGNQADPSMVNTWESYKDFNGIRLSTMHQDSTGGFKLYFTNISLK